VPAALWSKLGGWRAFADAVAIALGVNIWVSIILLPGLFTGAWHSAGAVGLALAPLAVLGLGVWRRSDAVLLFGYPVALLLPALASPALVASPVYGPVRFAIVAASLIAYLLGAALLTGFRPPRPPAAARPLSSSHQPQPARWRRRFRVYRMLALASFAFPVVLLLKVNFDADDRAFLREVFPGRVDEMTTLFNLAVVGVWIGLYVTVFLGALVPHRTGDRDLVVDLASIKQRAARGRPGPLFYLGVVAALGFMTLLMLLRYL
jgi:hypothetical protein